jgi:ABC-type dipeptide/oligopeptide/nickel transport system permease component
MYKELKSVYGEATPTYQTINTWVKRLETGNDDLGDKPKTGRPVIEETDRNLGKVRSILNKDNRLT